MRLPVWKRKSMIGEATLDSRMAVQAADMRGTFLDLIAQ